MKKAYSLNLDALLLRTEFNGLVEGEILCGAIQRLSFDFGRAEIDANLYYH